MTMLALVGSGEYLPPILPLDQYLLDHLAGSPQVICLPTAAGTEGPERIKYWSDLGVEHFSSLGAPVESLPIIDRISANDPDIVAPIHQANLVYLSGGKPDYLLKTLEDSLAWQAIQLVLDRGGLLAGCSAGAMIMGERIPGFPRAQPGFNLVPGVVVVPHYDEIPKSLTRVIRLLIRKGLTMLGIEGNTALFINGGNCEAIGLGSVTVWDSYGKKHYTNGQHIPEIF